MNVVSPALPDEDLTVCPTCDAVYSLHRHRDGCAARCGRCGHVLMTGREDAALRTLALAAASAILMLVVVFTPFLQLDSAGFDRAVSVYGVAMAFDVPSMWPLALSVFFFAIVLPWLRLVFLLYALSPALTHRAAPRGAGRALRWALELRPWAMAEIFMVGVAVALIKLAGMATLTLGVAFWAFASVVLLNAYKDAQMCPATLWAAAGRK